MKNIHAVKDSHIVEIVIIKVRVKSGRRKREKLVCRRVKRKNESAGIKASTKEAV